ncbi:MAG: HAD family hydrolase [Calditrichaeota bacterium]|nr:HAD family hydrolase [Calditrichota bacterium]
MPNWTKFKLIIFDLDGTITHAIHDFAKIKKELNLPPDQDILTSLHELNLEERLYAERRLQEIETELASQARLQDGIRDFLEFLSKQSIQFAVLTRNTRLNAFISLQVCGIRGLFQEAAVLGRDECPAKPDPSGIYNLLNVFNADKDQTAIIGDYKYDLLAGRNAGITSIYFDPDNEEKWNHLADFRINTYKLKLITNNATI